MNKIPTTYISTVFSSVKLLRTNTLRLSKQEACAPVTDGETELKDYGIFLMATWLISCVRAALLTPSPGFLQTTLHIIFLPNSPAVTETAPKTN